MVEDKSPFSIQPDSKRVIAIYPVILPLYLPGTVSSVAMPADSDFKLNTYEDLLMLTDQASPDNPNIRYLARITIFYGHEPEELLSDYSVNISAGGVFIEASRMLPEGTVLTVKFNLPDSDVVIYTHARVAWINDPENMKKPSLPAGMGIQFLSPVNHQALRDFLENSNLVPTW